MWGLPSGKIEKGEDSLEGVIREIREETGLRIPNSRISFFSKVYVKYPDCDFAYYIFHSKVDQLEKVKINYEEHKDFRWISPKEAFGLPLMQDLDACIRLFFKI